MTTEYLLLDLQQDEGLRLTAYPDPLTHAGPWTIGYGHTGPDVYPGLEWSQNQASLALAQDVATVCRELDQHIPWWRNLNDARQDVIANMAFNMGVAGLLGFHHTLNLIQEGDYQFASQAMLASRWAYQVGNRARRLSRQLSSGVHQS